jgi:hypothetical protein
MENLRVQASPAVDNLLSMDEDQLFNELGMRLKAVALDPGVGGSFDLAERSAPLESFQDFTIIGKRYFKNLNAVAYGIVCGSEDGSQALSQVINQGESAVAATIAALLVTQLGLAAAIAAALAAVIVKLFLKSATKTLCETWKTHLPESSAT